MRILNLTQHIATPAQVEAGVINVIPEHMGALKVFLTFEEMPTPYDSVSALSVSERVNALITLIRRKEYLTIDAVMIGGAPWLMAPLQNAIHEVSLNVVYAYSERVSNETMDPDTGIVHKTNVFEHVGFVEAEGNADLSEWIDPPYGAYRDEH
ncbi:MAG TPA: hypothetical protein EYQ00_15720 [Dehalococcoidia bacterium]|jgi:hypothetical protein|nr:hypothetical protein [Dehalococcoidia bacterium]